MQSDVGVNNYSCTAVENDWLDITYTQRNYIKEEEAKLNKFKPKRKPLQFVKANAKYIVATVLLVTAVAGMFIVGVDGDGVFNTAKLTYTSTIFDSLVDTSVNLPQTNKVVMPANMKVDGVSTDGVVTLSGGKIATCLSQGVVTATTDNSITVQTDDSTLMVYSNVSQVLVNVGDNVEQYAVLGRYEQSMTVQVLYGNQAVTDVIGTDTSFEWQS